ncbi:CD3324 family protein [Bacillus testis]|uniref:CD3324 family protein n=1 Tax=Bacillus testis TaxID=1622072 RepID=UPI00067E93B4|nr:CD3324 family protein [Bacillus testis]
MKYQSAQDLLPDTLLREVQKYIDGELLYIPVKGSARKKWGTSSGIRKQLEDRNLRIKKDYQRGASFEELGALYHLSPNTIKNIVYRQ